MKTIIKTKWFCALCWRNGEIDNGDLATAKLDHSVDVRGDMKAMKAPSGMDWTKDLSAIMLRFPGVLCKGDVRIGERQTKPRYEKPEAMAFDFGEEGIEQS